MNHAIQEIILDFKLDFPHKWKLSGDLQPYEPCTVLVFQGSDDGLTPHRRPPRAVVTKQQANLPCDASPSKARCAVDAHGQLHESKEGAMDRRVGHADDQS